MTIPFETARRLAHIPHGFFGRKGGISTGVYDSLNVSDSTGDDPAKAAANRASIATALGFDRTALTLVKQIHSNRVVTVNGPSHDRPEADAIVTNAPGSLLGILTADCVPVLLADTEAGVIAAAHAGWKGAVDGIIANTIAAMQQLGAEPSRIHAAIGPSISGGNYEVGPAFAGDLATRNPPAHRFIFTPEGSREHFDLPAFVLSQLEASGLASVARVGGCTYAEPDRYFSHRHATHHGTTTGRQIAVIGMT